MTHRPADSALVCTRCGERLEAAAKVYFELTAAVRCSDGALAISGLEFDPLNDSFDGHPAAIESDLLVSCKGCGKRVEFRLAGAALARSAMRGTQLLGGEQSDPESLLAVAREIYQGARDGQAAVEAWARGVPIAPHVSYRRCEPCEAATPHIAGVCAVCESGTEAGAGR